MLSVKNQLVLFSALLFIIIGSNQVYALTDKFIGSPLRMRFVSQSGAPTSLGIFVHAIVFDIAMWAYLKTFNV